MEMTKLTEDLCCCCCCCVVVFVFFVVIVFINDPRGLSVPAHGLYTCTWPLFSNSLANQSQILSGASLGQFMGHKFIFKKMVLVT